MTIQARDLWTYFVVTIVTILIWLWAAGETRQEKPINYARVQFVTPDPDHWTVAPDTRPISVMVQGSRLSIEKVESALRQPLLIEVRAAPGGQVIDLTRQLRNIPEITDTGARVRSVEPANVEVILTRSPRG